VALAERVLVSDFSWILDAGELGAIVGPSGAGKTTLLRALVGLQPTEAGRVTLFGAPPESIGLPAFRRRVHLVPRTPVLGGDTVGAALERPFAFGSARAPLDRDRLHRDLDALGLDRAIQSRSPESLSAGESQRMAVLRGLALDPAVLLLDEPTSALDERSADALRRLIASRRAAGMTVVVATHDPDAFEPTAIAEPFGIPRPLPETGS